MTKIGNKKGSIPLRFVLGGSRGGQSFFPPFQRWSQPGASSLDETPDLPLPAGDQLAGQAFPPAPRGGGSSSSDRGIRAK